MKSLKRKPNFEKMVKDFLKETTATPKDIRQINSRLDRIEKKLDMLLAAQRKGLKRGGFRSEPAHSTASDVVLEIITGAGRNGTTFDAIQDRTGYPEKKIRNIIYRLMKLGKISRPFRGVYAGPVPSPVQPGETERKAA